MGICSFSGFKISDLDFFFRYELFIHLKFAITEILVEREIWCLVSVN